MKLILVIVCLVNSVLPEFITGNPDSPVVHIPHLGRVRGTTTWSFFTGRPIYNYLGINYAKAPSARRRFQPPEDFEPWSGVYDATKMRQACPQIHMSYYPVPPAETLNIKQDIEDCLVVNIFTPKLPTAGDPLLPVMYLIHGGSFTFGSAHDFHPEFLLEKDLLLVVVQYRLGALGFMSLHTDDIPGNAGMLDIVKGLYWVQKNIKYFGGNSSQVTVVGQSAGAAAASALLITPLLYSESPSSRPLFHKTLIQSGSAISIWAVETNPVRSARRIAQISGCLSNDLKILAECLRHVPAQVIIRSHIQYVRQDVSMGGLGNAASGLVVQRAGAVKFLVEHPQQSFARGNFLKIPMMGGTTRDEGTSFLSNFYDLLSVENMTSTYFHWNITRDVLRYCGYDDGSGGLTDFYQEKCFGGPMESFDDMSAGLVDICGTLLLKSSTYHTLRMASNFNRCYIYSFNYFGNVSKLRAAYPTWNDDYPFPTGVAHSDELGYLFPAPNNRYTDKELAMVKVMTDLWANFVIKGKPSPAYKVRHWPVMSTVNGPYLRITEYPDVRDSIIDEFSVTSREGHIGLAPLVIPTPILLVMHLLACLLR